MTDNPDAWADSMGLILSNLKNKVSFCRISSMATLFHNPRQC